MTRLAWTVPVGYTPAARPPTRSLRRHMRNFFRAIGHAWPYRYRLALSLGAAVVVALLWLASLSSIYPVLTILSDDDQNLQSWVATEIKRADDDAANPQRQNDLDRDRKTVAFLNKQPQPLPEFEARELMRATARVAQNERELHDANWRAMWFRRLELNIIRQLPTDRFEQFAWIMAALLVAVALKGLFEFWQEVLVGSTIIRTVSDLRNRFYRLAIHQDVRQVQQTGTAELMARVTNDLEQVGTGMKILLGKMVVEPLRAAVCVVGAFFISWQLTVLFLVLVVPTAVVMGRISRRMKKASRKVLERMSELYRVVRETFDGIRVVKAFTTEPAERQRFRKANADYARRSVRVLRLDAVTGPLVELLGVAAVGMALLAGAYLVLNKETGIPLFGFKLKLSDEALTIKGLLTLYIYLGMVADPVRRLSSVFSKLQVGWAAADRVYALADRTPQVGANAGGPRVPLHAESVEFRNVCFSYVPGQVPGTLNGVDLKVVAGETVAIVGPNGCGKTTLLNMLARFLDPDHGAVLVDGVNLRAANLRSLRKQLGLVTQDTVLFNATIAENIAYGRPHATHSQIEEAARKAFAHEFIIHKPHGYDEPVGDGGSALSGGQRQRIALARAILRDPRILILDEFTSQIDAESEAKIQQALRVFVEGRTTFLITHRASTLELADRIVVMEAGRVTAVGPHVELLATCPAYQRLYEAQMAGQQDTPLRSISIHKAG